MTHRHLSAGLLGLCTLVSCTDDHRYDTYPYGNYGNYARTAPLPAYGPAPTPYRSPSPYGTTAPGAATAPDPYGTQPYARPGTYGATAPGTAPAPGPRGAQPSGVTPPGNPSGIAATPRPQPTPAASPTPRPTPAPSPAPLPTPAPPSPPTPADDYPTAVRVPENPDWVISPFDPTRRISVDGIPSGELRRDPENRKIFRVP